MTAVTFEEVKSAILSGKFSYEEMSELALTIDSKLSSSRTARTISSYGVGDKVKFNSLCGTKYLHGETAIVTGSARTKLIVKLEKPIGRFVRTIDGKAESVDIRVPPSIVDLVS
jgi:hypothetical protein